MPVCCGTYTGLINYDHEGIQQIFREHAPVAIGDGSVCFLFCRFRVSIGDDADPQKATGIEPDSDQRRHRGSRFAWEPGPHSAWNSDGPLRREVDLYDCDGVRRGSGDADGMGRRLLAVAVMRLIYRHRAGELFGGGWFRQRMVSSG